MMRKRKELSMMILMILLVILLSSLATVSRAQSPDDPTTTELFVNPNSYPLLSAVPSPQSPWTFHRLSQDLPSILAAGHAVETFGHIAEELRRIDPSLLWYPTHEATVVFLIDRSRTDAVITGWEDLLASGLRIAYDTDDGANLFMALEYALGGDMTDWKLAPARLQPLYEQRLLLTDTQDTEVRICWDYQAAALIANAATATVSSFDSLEDREKGVDSTAATTNTLGQTANLSGTEYPLFDIILPIEGTLSYPVGFLSATPIAEAESIEMLWLEAGFRLADGRVREGVFPEAEQYERAASTEAFPQINQMTFMWVRTLRREVMGTSRLSGADGSEHQRNIVVLVVVYICWVGFAALRILDMRIRRAILVNAFLVVSWIAVRMIKFQLPFGTLSRMLWYLFYLFMLGIPVVFLWIARSTDRPEKALRRWWFGSPVWNTLCFLGVMTNDWHQLAFRMDLTNPEAAERYYSYGPLYYIVLGTIFIQILAFIVILIRKGAQNPGRAAYTVPFLFCITMVLYTVGYVLRLPLFTISDLTMVTCVLSLLFTESCIRVGLIPANRRFEALFSASTLNMLIFDREKRLVLSSADAREPPQSVLSQLTEHPGSSLQEDDTLYCSDSIAGGLATGMEDVRHIRELEAEIRDANQKLLSANSLLENEKGIRRKLAFTEARTALFSELEREIAVKTDLLSHLIEELPNRPDPLREKAHITLLLCYIKRRCNLFFREKESDRFMAAVLAGYLEELAEFSELAGIRIHIQADRDGFLRTRRATLMYDFLYSLAYWASEAEGAVLLVTLSSQIEGMSLYVLPSSGGETYAPEPELVSLIEREGGSLTFKDLDDAVGIRLFFPAEEAEG